MRLFVDHVSDRAVVTDRHDAPSRPLQVRICKHVSSLDRIPERASAHGARARRPDRPRVVGLAGRHYKGGHDHDAVPLIGSGRRRFHAGGF